MKPYFSRDPGKESGRIELLWHLRLFPEGFRIEEQRVPRRHEPGPEEDTSSKTQPSCFFIGSRNTTLGGEEGDAGD